MVEDDFQLEPRFRKRLRHLMSEADRLQPDWHLMWAEYFITRSSLKPWYRCRYLGRNKCFARNDSPVEGTDCIVRFFAFNSRLRLVWQRCTQTVTVKATAADASGRWILFRRVQSITKCGSHSKRNLQVISWNFKIQISVYLNNCIDQAYSAEPVGCSTGSNRRPCNARCAMNAAGLCQ